jgi:type I restriction enzyme S subunit
MNIIKNVPKLRFPGFSGEWEERMVGNIGEIIGGGTPDTSMNEYWNGNIIWLTPTEIKNKYIEDSERKITKLGLRNSSAKLLPPKTLLITSRATIGDIAIAMKECCTNQGFQSIIVNENNNYDFVYYDLLRYKDTFIKYSKGSTFKELSKNEMKKIKIKIPLIKEQQKIASFITAFDKKIEIVAKKIEHLESYKKGLMQKLLTGEIRFPGFYGEWGKVNLNKIFKNYNEKNRQHNYKQYTIGKNGIKLIDDIRYNILNHKTFKLNDLIIGIGINEINLNINIVNGCCSPIYTIYKIDEYILNPIFGYYYIPKKIYEYRNKITKISSRRNFDIIHKDLLNLQIPFPSVEEQQKIASFLTAIDKKIELNKNKIENLKTYKKGLLQKMFI